MSTPQIINRRPSQGAIAGVRDSVRFGLRIAGTEVLEDSVDLFYGEGPIYYTGQVFPEARTDFTFRLESYGGTTPYQPAERAIGGQGELILTKAVTPLPQIQEATYFFGGLEAPAEVDGPLMAEFTVRLNAVEATYYNDFSGVAFGLLAGKKGVAVKLYEQGTHRVEMHSAARLATTPPSASYACLIDWDDVWVTFKLLWYPAMDVVRLYASSGTDAGDTLLIDGKISDFSELPTEEQREEVPQAFFGHIASETTSISRWKFAALYNLTTAPIRKGIVCGAFEGFFHTNEAMLYRPTALPEHHETPWNSLPSSFGSIGGDAFLESDHLAVERRDATKSVGYYRSEPAMSSQTVFDFKASVESFSQAVGVETTGVEFYVDDGVRSARLAFLQDVQGTQYVGFLKDTPNPEQLISYAAAQQSFVNPTTYRIVFDPDHNAVSLYCLIDDGVSVIPTYVLGMAYSALPASSMPGPGLGFLHNANVGVATARLCVYKLRYSTAVRGLTTDQIVTPLPAGWAKDGNGTITAGDEYGTLTDADETEAGKVQIRRDYTAGMRPSNGVALEFRARVESYASSDVVSPTRHLTGFRAALIDDTYQTALIFADMGPPYGKIVFLQTVADPVENLELIRAGVSSVAATFAIVDWTRFTLYRLERTFRGQLNLYLNESDRPTLSFDQLSFPYAPSDGSGYPRLVIGHFGDYAKTVSQVSHVLISTSRGLEVCLRPVLTEAEALARVNYSVNYIANARSYENNNFVGLPAIFTGSIYYEDSCEHGWPDAGPLHTDSLAVEASHFNDPVADQEDFDASVPYGGWPDAGPMHTTFVGTAGRFDTANTSWEDFEDEWADAGPLHTSTTATSASIFDTTNPRDDFEQNWSGVGAIHSSYSGTASRFNTATPVYYEAFEVEWTPWAAFSDNPSVEEFEEYANFNVQSWINNAIQPTDGYGLTWNDTRFNNYPVASSPEPFATLANGAAYGWPNFGTNGPQPGSDGWGGRYGDLYPGNTTFGFYGGGCIFGWTTYFFILHANYSGAQDMSACTGISNAGFGTPVQRVNVLSADSKFRFEVWTVTNKTVVTPSGTPTASFASSNKNVIVMQTILTGNAELLDVTGTLVTGTTTTADTGAVAPTASDGLAIALFRSYKNTDVFGAPGGSFNAFNNYPGYYIQGAARIGVIGHTGASQQSQASITAGTTWGAMMCYLKGPGLA
jgi:hypothetical protein